jgi:hypothetical protein
MSTSPVKIGNMALANCGTATTIESFTENSVEAKQIKLWYDFARQQAFEAFDWNFARKRIDLATHSDDAPSNEWVYRYQYPSDALVIRRLENPNGKTDDAVPFEVENSESGEEKTILTDLQDARAVYTFDNQNPDMYSAVFINALASLLASYIGFVLTGKKAVVADNLQRYMVFLRMAEATRANERVEAQPRDTDWIRGRQ